MITIKGWHGTPATNIKSKLDAIATPISANLWEFDGTISDFASKYDEKFTAYPKYNEVFVTQYGHFGQR
jgi:hypothetical protein